MDLLGTEAVLRADQLIDPFIGSVYEMLEFLILKLLTKYLGLQLVLLLDKLDVGHHELVVDGSQARYQLVVDLVRGVDLTDLALQDLDDLPVQVEAIFHVGDFVLELVVLHLEGLQVDQSVHLPITMELLLIIVNY